MVSHGPHPTTVQSATTAKLCVYSTERYSDVQRSQHLTQADKNVFGQSYVANCSSVDGQSAFLDEEADHSHIDFFQSLARFREKGLPCDLPLKLEHELQMDPGLVSWNDKVRDLEGPALNEAKRKRASYLKTLKKTALRQYQDQWVQQRRDWKILTRGREQPNDPCKTDITRHMFLLMPERGRLAQKLTSETMLSPAQTRSAMRDMFSLCCRADPVVYLPGLEPVNDACPVQCCKLRMDRYALSRHWLICLLMRFPVFHDLAAANTSSSVFALI